MIPRSSTSPTGPRSSSSSRSRICWGGIQKRWASSARVDKDGDLVMDPAENSETRGRGRREGTGRYARGPKGRASGRKGYGANISHGTRDIQQSQQQPSLRDLGSKHAHIIEPHISHGILGEHESSPKAQTHDSSAYTIFRIRGLKESKAASNPDGGLKDLLNFLERKASGSNAEPRKIRIKKSHLEGENAIITASSEDSVRILKLNNFKFAGATLVIESYQPLAPIQLLKGEKPVMSQDAKNIEDRIKSILSTRYDANLKLLNLSALGHDPVLVQMGMFDVKNRISKLFPVLMVICDRLFTSSEQKREAIISVTLADNNLDSVSTVTTLAQTFPDLQNLDLSGNKFLELCALEGWRWKFRKLQNLQITGNPIEIAMPEYTRDIIKWFPALQILNGVQVRSLQEAAEVRPQTQKADSLTPIPTNGPDFRDANHIGEGFIGQFFALYDSDRNFLASQFYDAHSVFSLSINVSAPRSEQSHSSHPFSTVQFKQSRNLVKVKSPHTQTSRLFRGIEAIKSIWVQFPPTKHPELGAPPTNYVIDCHPLPGLFDLSSQSLRGVDGLILTVHGEYEEQNGPGSARVSRSFSRTFVLGPGSPGGSSVRVVSDTLMLRAWGPLSYPLASQNIALAAMQTEEELREENLTRQLIIHTHMTPEYAKMCLVETGWNLDQALIAFNASKSRLPLNAFVNYAP